MGLRPPLGECRKRHTLAADNYDDRWGVFAVTDPGPRLASQHDWINRAGGGVSNATGFDTTQVGLKRLLLRDDFHETLLSAGLGWGLPGGNRQLGAHATIEPGIFFGRGFGDLADSVSALRPFAISGAVSIEHPTVSEPKLRRSALGCIPPIQHLLSDRSLHTRPPASRGTALSVGTVGRVFRRYTATRQDQRHCIARNRLCWRHLPGCRGVDAGRGTGIKMNLLLFIDDLVPSIFGKPVFGE
jgi:hypothetical protein